MFYHLTSISKLDPLDSCPFLIKLKYLIIYNSTVFYTKHQDQSLTAGQIAEDKRVSGKFTMFKY